MEAMGFGQMLFLAVMGLGSIALCGVYIEHKIHSNKN